MAQCVSLHQTANSSLFLKRNKQVHLEMRHILWRKMINLRLKYTCDVFYTYVADILAFIYPVKPKDPQHIVARKNTL
jgi:type III secretion system FlhB-like substrate exporter